LHEWKIKFIDEKINLKIDAQDLKSILFTSISPLYSTQASCVSSSFPANWLQPEGKALLPNLSFKICAKISKFAETGLTYHQHTGHFSTKATMRSQSIAQTTSTLISCRCYFWTTEPHRPKGGQTRTVNGGDHGVRRAGRFWLGRRIADRSRGGILWCWYDKSTGPCRNRVDQRFSGKLNVSTINYS